MAAASAESEYPDWLVDADKALRADSATLAAELELRTQEQEAETARRVNEAVAAAMVAAEADAKRRTEAAAHATAAVEMARPVPAAPSADAARADKQPQLASGVLSAIDGLAAISMLNLNGGALSGEAPVQPLNAEGLAPLQAGKSIADLAAAAVAAPTRLPPPTAPVPAAAALLMEDLLTDFDPLVRAAPATFTSAATSAPVAAPSIALLPAPLPTEVANVPSSPWSPASKTAHAAAPRDAAPRNAATPKDGAVVELATMFPAMDHEIIEAVLRAAGSTEAAVDQLLQMMSQADPKAASPRAVGSPAEQRSRVWVPPGATATLMASDSSQHAARVTFKRGLFRSGPRVVS